MTSCEFCGTQLPEQSGVGRRALYCDSTCKNRAQNERKKEYRSDSYLLLSSSRMRTCLLCGMMFRPSVPSVQCCSKSCASKLVQLSKGEGSKGAASTCRHCGKSYSPKKSDRTTYCSRACAFADKAAKPKLAKVKPVKRCAGCGAETQSHYCSDDCRKAVARRKFRQYAETKHDKAERQCRSCNCAFTPVYASKLRTFCSEHCRTVYGRRVAKAQRRARQRSLPYESVDPIAVFERDGWQCHICGGHVPSDLRGLPVDLAPELDHIIPLAKGGHHVWDNLGLAHRKCNLEKSDRMSL